MQIIRAGQRPPEGADVYTPQDRTHPRIRALRPLALSILADYGNPVEPRLQVDAVVDWVARHLIHGHSGLRLPAPYTSATGTLPVGAAWPDVQARLTGDQQNSDNAYWNGFNHDGTVILDRILGTLNVANGTRANDGAMTRVTTDGSQAHYRYKDLASIRSVWCTHQHNVSGALLCSLGFEFMLSHELGHDPLRVRYGADGAWGYWCATYNERYVLAGDVADRPLDLLELRDLTQAGLLNLVQVRKFAQPLWDKTSYITASYKTDHPEGWPQIGVSLDSRIVGGSANRRTRAIDDPALATSGNPLANYPRTTDSQALPWTGAYISGHPRSGSGLVSISLRSGWSGTTRFGRQLPDGTWQYVAADLSIGTPQARVRVPEGLGRVEWFPVDADGNKGPSVVVST